MPIARIYISQPQEKILYETMLFLGEVLQGSHNIMYEVKDDTTGVSFVRNGVKEWVPVVVTMARC